MRHLLRAEPNRYLLNQVRVEEFSLRKKRGLLRIGLSLFVLWISYPIITVGALPL